MATFINPVNLSVASVQNAHKPPILKIPQPGSALQEAVASIAHNNCISTSLNDVYSVALDHSATHNSLSFGKQIHAHVIKRGSACDVSFLTTKLVYMYGKCGSLSVAQDLFDEMPVRTIFTYNAMIGAYVSSGDPWEAIELYSDLRFSGIPADGHTCSCVLKACAEVKDMCVGTEVHGYAVKLGLDCNHVVVNSLVNMYARCNNVYAAELLFDGTRKRDVVLFNLMISMYATNGMSSQAFFVFREMLVIGVVPSTFTFVAALQAREKLYTGMQVHAVVVKYGLRFDRYIANSLVVMYSKCRRIDEAARVFADVGYRDNVAWNSMLDAYVQNGLFVESLNFFRGMTNSGQHPDQVSIISILSACGRSGNLMNGMETHAFSLRNGMESDIQVGNTIIDMYAKCSKINFMDSAFKRIPEKDFISWATVIAGYVHNSCYVEALEIFRASQVEGIDIDEMIIESVLLACQGLKLIAIAKEVHGYIVRRELYDIVLQNTFVNVYGECAEVDYAKHAFEQIEVKNVVSWTSMIACYVHNGLANEALKLSFHMVRSGVGLDSVALLTIISAVTNSSALRKGKEIHGFLVRRCLHLEKPVASSLVDMYSSCGAVDDSYKVFSYIKDKDLVSWTSMIDAYGMHGQGIMAINLFRKMEDEKLVPDHITFLALLRACSHSALVHEGKRYFNAMQYQYNLEPWPEHYACLVDLLGRANCLEEAFKVVKNMNVKPTPAVWCALLGACRTHSNVEIGEIAAMELLDMEPENPGNYVLVSNVYAAAGRWEDVEKVRKRMKVKGLKKDPGCSWIEVGNRVHTFTTHDRSHPQSSEIYEELAYITEQLEQHGGYKAQTQYVLHDVEETEKVTMLHGHSERLALAYGLLSIPHGKPIRVTKNLRVCGDCHTFTKLVSNIFERELIVRDANRFHHFKNGICSCGDIW